MTQPDSALVMALQASKFGRGLGAEQTSVLASVFRLVAFRGGDVLAREGDCDNHLYAVVSGSLAVIKSHGQPEETTLALLHVGDLTHELGFIDGLSRYASLMAATGSSVLELERVALESLITRAPELLYHVMCVIVRNVHQTQTRMAMQATELTNYIVKQHGRY